MLCSASIAGNPTGKFLKCGYRNREENGGGRRAALTGR
jgi:hypothetical protein